MKTFLHRSSSKTCHTPPITHSPVRIPNNFRPCLSIALSQEVKRMPRGLDEAPKELITHSSDTTSVGLDIKRIAVNALINIRLSNHYQSSNMRRNFFWEQRDMTLHKVPKFQIQCFH